MIYTVQPGDTLQSIAANELGDSQLWQYLASINGIVSPYMIKAGDKLEIGEPTVTASPIKAAAIIVGILLLVLAIGTILYYSTR
jgi:LysM repeat protein